MRERNNISFKDADAECTVLPPDVAPVSRVLAPATETAPCADMGDNLPAIDFGTGRTVAFVSAGTNHNCAILDDGKVRLYNPRFRVCIGHIWFILFDMSVLI